MKRILFVTYDYPYPTNTGGKNRAFNMLKHSGNFRKYLYSFVRPDFRQEYIKEVAKIGVETIGTTPRAKVVNVKNALSIFTRKSIFNSLYSSEETLAELLFLARKNDIDIIHFESFFTGFFVNDKFRELGIKQIYGSENIEHLLYEDMVATAPFFLRPIYRSEVKRIFEEEKKMCKEADLCLAVSEADANIIRRYNKCLIVRNGVDLDVLKYSAPKKIASNLLFVGNFTYYPNVDAINYFYDEVFKYCDNNLKLTVIGKNVKSLRNIVSDERVESKDFIPNILDAYKNADIIVAPVRLGGGTNFKILEAMASGVPVVSLPHRLMGLKVTDKKNIIVAKDAKDFAKKINTLAADYSLRKTISKNARELVEQEYSWEVSGQHLAKAWESL